MTRQQGSQRASTRAHGAPHARKCTCPQYLARAHHQRTHRHDRERGLQPSEATIDTIEGSGTPRIRGFFSSERTRLGPRSQIRDLMTEYAVVGGESVTVSFADPSADDDLAAELGEQFSIRPFPFGVSDRTSQSVVNAYFSVLIEYGDKYEVLDFQSMIEVQATDTELDAALRNPSMTSPKPSRRSAKRSKASRSPSRHCPGTPA